MIKISQAFCYISPLVLLNVQLFIIIIEIRRKNKGWKRKTQQEDYYYLCTTSKGNGLKQDESLD